MSGGNDGATRTHGRGASVVSYKNAYTISHIQGHTWTGSFKMLRLGHGLKGFESNRGYPKRQGNIKAAESTVTATTTVGYRNINESYTSH